MRSLFLIIILFTSVSFPQDSTGIIKRYADEIYDDAMIYFSNCGAFFIAPFKAEPDELLVGAGVVGLNIALISQDAKLRKFFGRNTLNPMNGDLWDIPTVYGVVEYVNILSAGIYAAGLFTGETGVKNTGRVLMETITVSGLTALFLRYFTGRMRPPYTEDHNAFNWFELKEMNQSFPSGHAVVGVALSTVLAEQIDTWWSRTFFYGMAGLSSFVRLYNNQHWFTDVFAGSLIGLGAGLFMVNREKDRIEGNSMGKLSILPGVNGINLIYYF
jgi:membrane-associated phospholipid phosphatase